MKTTPLLTQTARLVVGAILVAALSACGGDSGPLSENGTSVPAVRYQVAYDQTEMTYSLQWPEGIAGGVDGQARASGTDGAELLTDYEHVRLEMGFDDQGRFSQVITFLEGDEEMGMPEEVFESVQGSMIPRSPGANPIVREVMARGKRTSYGRNGSAVREMAYDVSAYDVSPQALDSLRRAAAAVEDDTQSRVDANLARLRLGGVQPRLVGETSALIDQQETFDNGQTALTRQLVDLRHGQPVRMAVRDNGGRYLFYKEFQYAEVDGATVATYEVAYDFGDVDGRWTTLTKTTTARENIRVTIQE